MSFCTGEKAGGHTSAPDVEKRRDSSAPQSDRDRIGGWATLAPAGAPGRAWVTTVDSPSARASTVSRPRGRSVPTMTDVAPPAATTAPYVTPLPRCPPTSSRPASTAGPNVIPSVLEATVTAASALPAQ